MISVSHALRYTFAATCAAFAIASTPGLANPVVDWPYADLTIDGVQLTGITLHIETEAATADQPTRKHFFATCGAKPTTSQSGETVVSVHFNLLDAKGRLIDIVYNDNVILNSGIANCSADNTHWIVTDHDPATVQVQLHTTHIVDYVPVTLKPNTKHN